MSPEAVGTDSERMTVGMAEMELANAPRFVCGRHGYLEAQLHADAVHRIDLIRRPEKPRHPHPARRLVEGKRWWVRPSRPLPPAAEENLGVSTASTGEPRLAVVFVPHKGRLPPKRLEPGETAPHIGHVQDRPDDMHRRHCAERTRLDQALAWARPYGVPGASLVSWRGLPSGVARR